MSSIYQSPQRNWGFYRLDGALEYDGSEGPADPSAVWTEVHGCPGAEVLGSSLCLGLGTWRFRFVEGEAYGSVELKVLVKSLQTPDTSVALLRVAPEVEYQRHPLVGIFTLMTVADRAQVLVTVEPLGTKKGGILYPLTVYLERLV